MRIYSNGSNKYSRAEMNSYLVIKNTLMLARIFQSASKLISSWRFAILEYSIFGWYIKLTGRESFLDTLYLLNSSFAVLLKIYERVCSVKE